MKKLGIILLLIGAILYSGYKSKTNSPTVDLVFCIDLSSSTNGISNVFKEQIWGVMNNFSQLNPKPEVRLSIVGYGRPSFGTNTNYVQILSGLTTDIDDAVRELFKIDESTRSSNTNAANALSICLKKLDWSKGKNSMKQIYLIGNGPLSASLGSMKKMVKKASKKEIIVNPIFIETDSRHVGLDDWKEFASFGNKECHMLNLAMAQNYNSQGGTEEMLIDAGSMMNQTYVYYGVSGEDRQKSMERIDKQISSFGPRGAKSRALFKSSVFCQGQNKKWDLVDLILTGGFDVTKVEKRLLPENFQRLNDEMLEERVMEKKEERVQIVSIIQMLGKKLEDKYISNPEDENNVESTSLESLIISNFNETAINYGYSVKDI